MRLMRINISKRPDKILTYEEVQNKSNVIGNACLFLDVFQ